MRASEVNFINADSRKIEGAPDAWFHMAVTSPPYFGLRQYGEDGREIGNEQTPAEYVAQIVAVACEVRRVLREDGVFFMNIGDSYASAYASNRVNIIGQGSPKKSQRVNKLSGDLKEKDLIGIPWMVATALRSDGWHLRSEIIWAKAISFGDRHARNMRKAVIAAGMRNGLTRGRAEQVAAVIEPQIGACMPGSMQDRFTVSHEQIFLFTKSPDYFFDIEAVKEKGKDYGDRTKNLKNWKYVSGGTGKHPHKGSIDGNYAEKGRNLRTVWTVGTSPYKGDHYAVYPAALVKPMIKAGTSEKGCCPICGAPAIRVVESTKLRRQRGAEYTKRTGAKGTGNYCSNYVDGVATRTIGWRSGCDCQGIYPEGLLPCRVIDPFGGAGTTAIAADDLGRDCTLVELFAKNIVEAKTRLAEHRDRREYGKRAVADPNQLTLFADEDTEDEGDDVDETTDLVGRIESQFEMFGDNNGDNEAKPADHGETADRPAPVVIDA